MKKFRKFTIIIMILAGANALAACNGVKGEKKVEDTRKKIGVLVFQKVLTSDVTAPLEVFGAAAANKEFPYQVVAISVGDKNVTTQEGLKLQADYSIADKPQLDVLIVPGAYELERLYKNEKFMTFLKEQGTEVEYLASNCAGAFLLGKAGLLKGKKATTWRGGEKDLQKLAPHSKIQSDVNLVVDGNLVTSNGGVISYQAAMVLLEKMAKPEVVKGVADAITYNRMFVSK